MDILGLIGKLPGLKKASEFSSVIPEIEERLELARVRAEDLNNQIEDAIFTNPASLDGLRQRLAQNQADQESLRIALVGVRRREKEAAAMEGAAEVERRMKAARKAQRQIHESYAQLHGHIEAVCNHLSVILQGEKFLESENAFARENGRPDLMLETPWSLLMKVVGHDGYIHTHPARIVLPGYLPPHPDGPALARIKEVKLSS